MNPLVGTVPIRLDRERVLRFDMNALVRIERALDRSAIELFDDLGHGFKAYQEAQAKRKAGEAVKLPPFPMTFEILRAILFGCLAHEDPDLTLEGLGALVNLGNFKALSESVERLVKGAFGAGDGAETGPPGGSNGASGAG